MNYFAFYFSRVGGTGDPVAHVQQKTSGGYRYVKYDEEDNKEFHYHMFNAYENYSNNSNHASLQADGIFHDFTNSSIDYHKIGNPASSVLDGLGGAPTHTYDFTGAGAYHPSVTIGGQPVLGDDNPANGFFTGKIYEILVFKSEHAGGNVIDDIHFGTPFKKRWSNMLYYFQRKYQKITPKN